MHARRSQAARDVGQVKPLPWSSTTNRALPPGRNAAVAAAPRSVLSAVESIRALQVARRGAVKARTQAGNQLRDLIITAPQMLREKLAGLPAPQRVRLAARF